MFAPSWQVGGGFYISSGTVTLNNCDIHHNRAPTDGGGLSGRGGTVTRVPAGMEGFALLMPGLVKWRGAGS